MASPIELYTRVERRQFWRMDILTWKCWIMALLPCPSILEANSTVRLRMSIQWFNFLLSRTKPSFPWSLLTGRRPYKLNWCYSTDTRISVQTSGVQTLDLTKASPPSKHAIMDFLWYSFVSFCSQSFLKCLSDVWQVFPKKRTIVQTYTSRLSQSSLTFGESQLHASDMITVCFTKEYNNAPFWLQYFRCYSHLCLLIYCQWRIILYKKCYKCYNKSERTDCTMIDDVSEWNINSR